MPGKQSAERPKLAGRGPKMRAAVLAATTAELAESGFASLTIENVARRAGVHKTTIYRRWQERERLIVDALTERVAVEVPIPDTGSIETDVRELARGLVRWLGTPVGQAVTATMLSEEASRIPEIAAAKHDFYADRFQRASPVVLRAIERGELPPGTDPASVVKAFAAPIYFRLLVSAESLDDSVADQAAQVALAAARAGLLQSPG